MKYFYRLIVLMIVYAPASIASQRLSVAQLGGTSYNFTEIYANSAPGFSTTQPFTMFATTGDGVFVQLVDGACDNVRTRIVIDDVAFNNVIGTERFYQIFGGGGMVAFQRNLTVEITSSGGCSSSALGSVRLSLFTP